MTSRSEISGGSRKSKAGCQSVCYSKSRISIMKIKLYHVHIQRKVPAQGKERSRGLGQETASI
jgi:hypothetical protein